MVTVINERRLHIKLNPAHFIGHNVDVILNIFWHALVCQSWQSFDEISEGMVAAVCPLAVYELSFKNQSGVPGPVESQVAR